ncbi:MAG: hypothetical protein JWP91_1402 [Fibrobacteres bacterium]|nr:hypothetical protein [Fibrobacterota bacterium]
MFSRGIRFSSFTALTVLTALGTASAVITWKPLWDGKTLNGWHNRGKDAWTVEKETPTSPPALHGKHVSATDDYSMLYTDKSYDFFTLRVSYRMLEGNSGVYVKAKELAQTPFVAGIQVDLDAVNLLSLYCTSCGAGVYSPPADIKARILKNGWNDLVVTAKGDNLFTSVNGADMPAWNYKGKEFVLPSGPFGLQLHDLRLDEAWFRDIGIMEGCTDKSSPRYDKETEDPRLYVIHNPANCAPPAALAPEVGAAGNAGMASGLRFSMGRVDIGVSGAYRLTVRDMAGNILAVRGGESPGSFRLPEIRSAGAYLATLETGSGSVTRRVPFIMP